jgi:ADP-ribose pyrophosphatase YjhB (NUDIX family)
MIDDQHLNQLLARHPGVSIVEAFQEVSETDFSLQKQKHLSRRAKGGAIGIIQTPDGRIVLTKRSSMHAGWSLPGGTVEADEEFIEAYAREIAEEIGIPLESTRLILIEKKVFRSPSGEELPFLLAIFASKTGTQTLPPPTPEALIEGLQVALFDPAELPSQMILSDKEKIRRFLGGPSP